MSVLHKYFHITCVETVQEIKDAIASEIHFQKELKKLTKKFGATEAFRYNHGKGLAGFEFKQKPDPSNWKKTRHGFLPKVKSDEAKALKELPEYNDFRSVINKFGLGKEMVLGKSTSRGVQMHSSYIRGNQEKNVWFVVVPYNGEFTQKLPETLVEVREWEMLRDLDAEVV